MNMELTHCKTYRGFEIAVKPSGVKTFWRPCWRQQGTLTWTEGCVLEDDAAGAERLARECVDYQYRVEVWEFETGRKYDAMKDGCIPAND